VSNDRACRGVRPQAQSEWAAGSMHPVSQRRPRLSRMSDSLDVALADAVHRYVERNPHSSRLARAAAEVMPGGNTRSVLHTEPFGVRIDSAEGAVLTTVDGDHVVDLLGDYSAGLLGRRPEVADAVRGVLDRGWGYGAMSEPETDFARALVERFASVDQVRFTNSGSEADLMAVLTAHHVTGRRRRRGRLHQSRG
jgi:glutamate-1-semialdehyde 2,1-aminomutase